MNLRVFDFAAIGHISAASFRVTLKAGLGLTVITAAVHLNKINNFDPQPIRSHQIAVHDKIESGKTCTSCHRWRPTSQYHRNKSKVDQLESHCRDCVSRRKELRRQRLRQLERKCSEFESVIVGGTDHIELDRFAEIFGAAVKEVLDGDEQAETLQS